MDDKYVVQPVYKALQVLNTIATAKRPLTLSELALRTNLPKSTVFRYLHTLRIMDYIDFDTQADGYVVGLRLWELGTLNRSQHLLREAALPEMQALQARFNETINLGVMRNGEIIYLEMLEIERPLRMQARLGSRDAAYATAIGKAILAFLSYDERQALLPDKLKPLTENTITDKVRLEADLAATRARGYALDNAENEQGAVCIGAPIFDESGGVVAAISLSAPASRLDNTQEAGVGQAMRAAADTISARLQGK